VGDVVDGEVAQDLVVVSADLRPRQVVPDVPARIGAASAALSKAVVAGLGGAFRPAEVVFVPDLPRTRTMKVMRRVVRAAWLGEEPGDLSTLSNPESVQAIRDARQ
jgi:acetyl-CoA synthetase